MGSSPSADTNIYGKGSPRRAVNPLVAKDSMVVDCGGSIPSSPTFLFWVCVDKDMSDFWRQHKGGLVISIFSVFLGATVQLGISYFRNNAPAVTSPVPQPVVSQPFSQPVEQPVIRYTDPPVIYTTPARPVMSPSTHSKHR